MKIIRKILIVLYIFIACCLFLMPLFIWLSGEASPNEPDFWVGVLVCFGVGAFFLLNAALLRGNANDDSRLIGLGIEARKAEFRRRIRERNASNYEVEF